MGKQINFSGRARSCKIPAPDGQTGSKVSSFNGYHPSTLSNKRKVGRPKGSKTKIRLAIVKEKAHRQPLEVERHNEGGLTCLACGKLLSEVKGRPKKMLNQVCNNACRSLLTQRTNAEAAKVAKELEYAEKPHNRKCRICNKDCFPNYFFCPSCLPNDPY